MSYRGVVRHVRYWRGAVHRWSTVYQFVGTPSSGITTTDCHTLLDADNKMLYATGPSRGGSYECAIYNQASGGVPVAVYTAFDWTAPAGWLVGSASAWATPSANPAEPAEAAMLVEWPAGLSSSGKPVRLRKWYHMVPTSSAIGGAVDIVTSDYTPLLAAATSLVGVLSSKGLVLGSSTGRFAGTAPIIDRFYCNHQMGRGRKRKVTTQARQAVDFEKILEIINGQAQPVSP
jgi:hypothetical protein